MDYRQFNAQMENEVSQLPAIRDLLHELGQATVFSSLDLKAGYWQVLMHPKSMQYIAFSTPDGATYEFLVIPFS